MAPIRFAFGLHLHQPVGNFDHVFAQHVDDVYRPLLDALTDREFLPGVLHLSGPLIEWLESHEPAYLDRLGRLAADGRIGLKVMTEMGRKNVDVPFDADEICAQILGDIELGVSKIYLESSEIQALYQADPAALDKIAGLGRNEYLLFELGLIDAQDKAAWLVERYGPEINFASVSPADVIPVDAIRRGVHRKAAYRYFTQMRG